MFKFVVLSVFLAVASAGYLGVPAASFGHSVAYAAPAVRSILVFFGFFSGTEVVGSRYMPLL